MPTPYATNAEADVYNTGDVTWDGTSEGDKTTALEYARRYIDMYYLCATIDMAAVPDDVKQASAILALAHLSTPLYNTKPTSESLKSKSVRAGSVSSSKTFASDYKITDPFPEVTMLLSSQCKLKRGGVSSATLGRS